MVDVRMPSDRLIVALDYPTLDRAIGMVHQLAGTVSWFKVGLELIHAEGANNVVAALRNEGVEHIFLDLKLHDIGNTVSRTVKVLSSLGVDYLTVDASLSENALRAAIENAGSTTLLAVTVLTDMTAKDCARVFGVNANSAVKELTVRASKAGFQHVVCSATDLKDMADFMPYLRRITPGIRPIGSAKGDQARIATPATAIRAGAYQLVVGRPITESTQPAQAAQAIIDEIAGALPTTN